MKRGADMGTKGDRNRMPAAEAAAAAAAGILCGAGLFLLQKHYLEGHVWIAAMWGTGAFFLTLIAWIDYREHRIPNILVLLLLAAQSACLLADRSGFGTEVTDRLLGLLFPVLLILGAEKIYPGGLGAGDGKLLLVLGFILGFSTVVRLLFTAVLMLAAVSLYAVWKKKADWKTVFPMGPAIWAAYLIAGCLLLFTPFQ